MPKVVAKGARAPQRRGEALSRDRIVDAAIALLDDEGENGLTFRALATRLATGSGAIYWHVANKGELLVAATDALIARTLADVSAHGTPRKKLRSIASGVFEAIDAHPWVGAQLSRSPWPTATLQIFERVGRELQSLRVPEPALFTATSALLSYVLGVSSQNAANGRLFGPNVDRASILAAEAARWKQLDESEYPFTRSVAPQLRKHDDRAEFLAGMDLILTGIEAQRAR